VWRKQRLLALGRRHAAVDSGLTFDPVASRRDLRGRERRLAKFIEQVGPFRLRPAEAADAVRGAARIHRSTSSSPGKAAATILARVVALFPPRRFPRPQEVIDIPAEKLRGAGLVAGRRQRALKDLAAKTLDGTVPASARALEKLSDDEDRRAPHRGARHRPLDGGDAAHLPPGAAGRPARH